MMLVAQIKAAAAAALKDLYPEADINGTLITVNQTKPEFTGDYTVVLFPFVKSLRQKPDVLGNQLGAYLVEKSGLFERYDIVSGFLNLTVKDSYWTTFLTGSYNDTRFGEKAATGKKVMIEYSSPNTNKPLHFGHLRNIFLGYAVANIEKAAGHEVIKANLINDRGIHICKSMIAWMRYANGATPETTGIKGDHLVGDYYVRFNDELNNEIKPILSEMYATGIVPDFVKGGHVQTLEQAIGSIMSVQPLLNQAASAIPLDEVSKISAKAYDLSNEAQKGTGKWKDVLKSVYTDELIPEEEKEKKAKELRGLLAKVLSYESEIDQVKSDVKEVISFYAPIMKEAQELLRKWEAGDAEVRRLWEMMNGWVYEGFNVSYRRLGVDFDKMYYESETYLLGKAIVEKGLEKGVLYRKDDGSVWIDLTADGLDQKLLLRGDGTSVYMTQDLGTAVLKYNDFNGLDQSVYVIADEQNYHMQVLKLILQKLGEPCGDGIYHLSYGMVELPSGRMKSREGTVVDADDMMDEMLRLSEEQTKEAGKAEGFEQDELKTLYETLGMGALKFYLLRVDPKKKMIFDPKESIDLHGFTATFIQYAHARACRVLRLLGVPATAHEQAAFFTDFAPSMPLTAMEKGLVLALEQYPSILEAAAEEFNPSLLCNYSFQLAQLFNSFYDDKGHAIAKAEHEEKKQLRLMIAAMTILVLRHAMNLCGIRLPERM